MKNKDQLNKIKDPVQNKKEKKGPFQTLVLLLVCSSSLEKEYII